MSATYPTDSKNLFLSIIGGTIVAIVVLFIEFIAGTFNNNKYAFWIGLIVLFLMFFGSICIYSKSPKKQ